MADTEAKSNTDEQTPRYSVRLLEDLVDLISFLILRLTPGFLRAWTLKCVPNPPQDITRRLVLAVIPPKDSGLPKPPENLASNATISAQATAMGFDEGTESGSLPSFQSAGASAADYSTPRQSSRWLTERIKPIAWNLIQSASYAPEATQAFQSQQSRDLEHLVMAAWCDTRKAQPRSSRGEIRTVKRGPTSQVRPRRSGLGTSSPASKQQAVLSVVCPSSAPCLQPSTTSENIKCPSPGSSQPESGLSSVARTLEQQMDSVGTTSNPSPSEQQPVPLPLHPPLNKDAGQNMLDRCKEQSCGMQPIHQEKGTEKSNEGGETAKVGLEAAMLPDQPHEASAYRERPVGDITSKLAFKEWGQQAVALPLRQPLGNDAGMNMLVQFMECGMQPLPAAELDLSSAENNPPVPEALVSIAPRSPLPMKGEGSDPRSPLKRDEGSALPQPAPKKGKGSAPIPPPPPRKGKGGPPPPPPPPATRKGKGGAPPPPVPPKGGQKGGNKEQRRLKAAHWEKVTPHDNSLWMGCLPDLADFEAARISRFEMKESKALHRLALKQERLAKKVTFVDSKRAQNVGVVLAGIRMPRAELQAKLENGDLASFSDAQVDGLVLAIPTEAEQKDLQAYLKGEHEAHPGVKDPALLGDVDTYFASIMTIPRLEQRIKCCKATRNFADGAEMVGRMVGCVRNACVEVTHSRDLLLLLKALLLAGNALNEGTSKGGARAFRLGSVLRLAETRSGDGQTNLLKVAIEELVRQVGVAPATFLHQQLPSLQAACRIEVEDLQKVLGGLTSGLATIAEEASLVGEAAEEPFAREMHEFCASRSAALADLQEEEERMQADLARVAAWFCEAFKPKDSLSVLRTLMEVVLAVRKAGKEVAESGTRRG